MANIGGKDMDQKQNGTWVYVGRKYDSDVFINLDTGEKKHIGTKLTSDDPEIYKGEPSFVGFMAGQIIKRLLGKK